MPSEALLLLHAIFQPTFVITPKSGSQEDPGAPLNPSSSSLTVAWKYYLALIPCIRQANQDTASVAELRMLYYFIRKEYKEKHGENWEFSPLLTSG